MMDNYRWTSAGITDKPVFWNSVCIDEKSKNIYSIGGIGLTYLNYNYYNFFSVENRIDTISVYNVDTKKVTEFNPSYPCMGCACGYYDGAIYLVGGWYAVSTSTASNSSGTLYYYQYASLDIVKCVLSGENAGIVNISTLNTKINNPAYVQDNDKIYIFGGGTVNTIGNSHNGYNNSGVQAAHVATFDGDNKNCYVFNMNTETLESLPNLPITGGLSLRCCKVGNDIFIRNRTEFCKFNILTKKFIILPSFDQTNSSDIPDLFPIKIDNIDYICSFGGITSPYQQLYNIKSDIIEDSTLKFPLRQETRSICYNNKPYVIGGYKSTSPIDNKSVDNILTLEEVV